MTDYTIKDAVSVSNGKYFGDEAILAEPCADVVIDSRKATKGSIFAAIRGERVDGYDFIESAMQNGAICVIAERAPANPDIPHILVSSVPAALRFIAAHYREQFHIPIIGVTGSVGKTSTKEMISCVMKKRMELLYTEGNFNNELGVPLTLFRLNSEHRAAVIEMGISDFNEMTRLTRIVKPNAAVFTAIGDAHLENLGSREGVLKAKAEILDGMPMGTIAFINGDDELLVGMEVKPRKKISFGLGEKCDIRATNVKNLGADGSSCLIMGLGREFEARIPAYGHHMLYAALAAAAVGLYFGFSGEEISAGLLDYVPVGHRASAIDVNGITVIDDCYNANPTSVHMALESLSDFTTRRRVAILGDMLELGDDKERFHYEVGARSAQSGAVTIACGALAKGIAKGASVVGGETAYFEDVEALLTALPGIIKPGDAVLVKASRGMHLEAVVEKLTSPLTD